ncbi:WD40 repeat domain-containing protein [Embleya hyalina]|uniref:WD40 repeat domain-containing protein n=1 Tax=Embleya hyalina TaxID=516124 RepID=UPI00135CDFD8|nr:WD40 repeat domain-containing protein [Embleya hyalina]
MVYVAGHGHGCGCADADDPRGPDVVPGDGRIGPGVEVGRWIADAERADAPTLFLLDPCWADATRADASAVRESVDRSGTSGRVWVIAAGEGEPGVCDGRFGRVLARVLDEVADTGLDADPARSHVAFSVVARRIRRVMAEPPGRGRPVYSTATPAAPDEPTPPFFPNPRFDPTAPGLAGVDPALRVFLESGVVGCGVVDGRARVGFVGRRSALRALVGWSDDVEMGGLRVVAGGPGVGKSALLSMLACAAHPVLVAAAPQVRRRLLADDPRCCPAAAAHMAAVHARGRTRHEILAAIVRQLVPDDPRPDDLLDAGALARLLGDGPHTPAILVDALDEALEPAATCADLADLAWIRRADRRPAVRLIVAARRRPMFDRLFELARAQGGLLDLDAADPDEVRADLAAYLRGRLAEVPGYRPPAMGAIREALARAVADRLASRGAEGAEWGAFLIADVFAHHVAAVPPPADPDEAARRGVLVPTELPAVLDLDLGVRADGEHVRAVLAALAHARGEGMPAEVALPLAGLFAPDLDPERARALPPDALFHVRATPDHDGTLLYRLRHRALVDHLVRRPRPDADPGAPSPGTGVPTAGAVLDRLLECVGRAGARRGWDAASPYVLRHVLGYAEAAGRLGELLADDAYLACGDPADLLAAFARAGMAERWMAAVVRPTPPPHGAVPPARRRLLALEAHRRGAPALAAWLNRTTAPGAWKPIAAGGTGLADEPRGPRHGHGRAVWAVAFATVAGRPVVVTGGQDDRIRIRRLDIPDPLGATLAEPVWWVHAIACATVRGRPIAATGSRDNAVRLWDLTSRARLGEPLTGHTGWVTALACVTLRGRPIVVSGSADATVRMWDPLTGRSIGTPLTGHTGPVHALACTVLDGRPFVVSGSADGTIRVWDPADGRPVGAPMTGHTGVVHALACTTVRGRPIVVSAAGDATARVWDPRAGTSLGRPLTGHADGVHAVACATVGGRSVAATGADDHTARIWDLDAGRLLDRILLPAPSRALTFTPRGLLIAFDTDIGLWARQPADTSGRRGAGGVP